MSLRRPGRPRAPRRGLLDLELRVGDDRLIHLDHRCPGDGTNRLLGVELTGAELALLRGGGVVAIAVGCDRCLWERRLLLRRRESATGRPQPPMYDISTLWPPIAGSTGFWERSSE